MEDALVSLHVTLPDAHRAQAMARTLVDERLVACVNIVPGVTSVYRWEGERQEDSEVLFLAKTAAPLLEAVTRRITELHPYELPCVVAVPVVGGLPEYLDWVRRTTGEGTR